MKTQRYDKKLISDISFLLIAGVFSLVFSLTGYAQSNSDWPQWRGVNQDGISEETNWKTDWQAKGPKMLWELNLGVGVSSIVTSGGRVYSMGNRDNKDIVYCLDSNTGNKIWTYSYPCLFRPRSFEGGPASTPTVNEGRLYTLSERGHLYCFEATSGKVIWKTNIVDVFGGKPPSWAYAGSPLVVGDLLILDIGGDASTIALNKKDGRLIWKSGRDRPSYATPVVIGKGPNKGVLIFKGRALVCLRISSGKELWRYPWKTSYDVNASTPIVYGRTIFISSGYRTGCALLQVRGNIVRKLWKNNELEMHMGTSVAYNGYLYGVNDLGELKCVDMRNGQAMWTHRGFGKGTLTIAGGKLIILSERGKLVVAEATPNGYKQNANSQVLQGTCWVTPVISNGRIYVRSNNGRLKCFDVRKKDG